MGRLKILSAALAVILAATGAASAQAPAKRNFGAVGQIVPAGGIIVLSGQPGAVVREVRVHPGDFVKAGAVLMTLEGGSVKADLDLANQDLQSARKLVTAQVSAQKLAVSLAQQHLDDAARQVTVYQGLGDSATSKGELTRLQAAQTQARISLQMEQAKLIATTTDTNKTLGGAQAQQAKAQAAAEIRAPVDGTILRIDRRGGQSLGTDPAVEMGDLGTMYVTCQVYQGDLLKLAPGMRATATGATLGHALTGTIDEVGRIVDSRTQLGEVRVRLDSPQPANRLVGMEVEVVFGR